MTDDSRQQRVLLTYQDASYTRLLIYIVLFALGYGYARLSYGREDGVPWYEKIVLVVIFLSFFLSIFEGLFVLNAKLFYKRVEFDGTNLYIKARGKETVVPLSNITRIDMLGSGRGSRGTFYGYEIAYLDGAGTSAWVYVTVYWKKTALFEKFIADVKAQNPGVTIKKITTSIDALMKIFKRKKAAV